MPVRRLIASVNSSRFKVSEALPLESKRRLTSPRMSAARAFPRSSSIAFTSPVSSRPTEGSSNRNPSSSSSALSETGTTAAVATASSRASATPSIHSPKWRAQAFTSPRFHSTIGSSESMCVGASRSKQRSLSPTRAKGTYRSTTADLVERISAMRSFISLESKSSSGSPMVAAMRSAAV